jgi:pyoverdine/dityrosine biosynthesis protein Dit1
MRTKDTTYAVIQRSDAWGRLVATVYPDALRLSIHPQPRVSQKVGIHLLETEDAWLTPWHGVALLDADRALLVKRHQAEAGGAILVNDAGPAHFVAR